MNIFQQMLRNGSWRHTFRFGFEVHQYSMTENRISNVLNILLHISKTSDGQRISTYQDILHNRRTEIDTLNFAIAEIARKSNNIASVKETRLLGELIAAKSGN